MIVVPAGNPILKQVTFSISNQNLTAIPFVAYVYAWTGTAITGPALYTSSLMSMPPTGGAGNFIPVTVTGINTFLTPGSSYAVFFTTIGQPGVEGNSFWQTAALGAGPLAGAKFVYNNSTTFAGLFTPAPLWNEFGDFDNAAFSMTFGPGTFLITYAANLTAGDGVINLTNTGSNGASLTGPGFGGAVGNLCMNVYTFSPDEQLVSCCSCLVTPNGLAALSVNEDLVSNTLTGVRPNSVVVKVVPTGAGATFTGATCTNSAATAGNATNPLIASGALGFSTTVHAQGAAFATTETPLLQATLSDQELASITNRCTNIIGNGSTFGICRSCRSGGLSASR